MLRQLLSTFLSAGRRAVVALVLVTLAGGALAAEKNAPVPRFVSLRASEVNLRSGPGERYPIEWVLTRKGLPVEVVAEFDVWRKIRASDGTEGWVHERMVGSGRNVIIKGEVRTLHAEPDAAAPPVARAEAGVIAHLVDCRGPWCRIETEGIKGWVKRSEIWGVYPDEAVP